VSNFSYLRFCCPKADFARMTREILVVLEILIEETGRRIFGRLQTGTPIIP